MHDKNLKRALGSNAAFSAATGLALVTASGRISNWLGAPQLVILAVGIGLLPFALVVATQSKAPKQTRVLAIVAADVGWVLGSVGIILGSPQILSVSGLWVVGLVSAVVAGFAAFQGLALRRASLGGELENV